MKILPNQYPGQLAQELDCTVQKIRRIVDKLEERDLVKRDKDRTANDRTIYVLTETADGYF
ncbi:MarR family winged helix-turn-helix transcriptional regulator [Lysinibacillus sp. M3]|uniref:MarR family winged helix-turn-helix transcriptional regulator n=1 Tax=Lysinibacillus zambalensis TaxID=3160866 RepID=A0ABV1MZS1_9BACI